MTIRKIFNKRLIIIGLLLIVIGAGYYFWFGNGSKKTAQYKFVSITKGNLETVISSSGTLSPVTEVEVGTQVSGTIDKVLVDFNDKVKKGQIIAILDTSILKLAVTDAKSELQKAKAQLEEAQSNYMRNSELFDKGLVSESDLQTAKTTYETSRASVTMAEVALERAELNLKYAIIRSPIDGTVINRDVEEGQTVAASLSTPTLFTIAEDLSKMEIKAAVDESDIGDIKEGMPVRFTVQAYPDKKFEGVVKQIRAQPTTTSNVVNYTVMVSAENKDNLLLPGMTATVDFIISQKTNVLLVPSSALKFQPSEDELEELHKEIQNKMVAPPPDSMRNTKPVSNNGSFPQGTPPPNDSVNTSSMKRLWCLDKEGKLTMIPVLVGITDGTNTEILDNPMISEGMQIISGSESSTTKDKTTTNDKSQSGPPGGGPPPF